MTDYQSTVTAAVQAEAKQAHAALISYLADPKGPAYQKLRDTLVGLIAVLRIAGAGQPAASLGVDGTAVLAALDRLTGLRGASARNLWLNEGVPSWIVAVPEVAKPQPAAEDE